MTSEKKVSSTNLKIIGYSLAVLSFGLALAYGGMIWYLHTHPKQVMCTMEAKQCPDGSYVERSGPNCEFAPCPFYK